MPTPKQAERAQRIVQAAQTEFSKAGLLESSVDRIASAARVAKSTIYRHYGSKEGLFRAAFHDALNRMERTAVGRQDPRKFETFLRRIIRNLLQEVCRDPGVLLVFRTIGSGSRITDPLLQEELTNAYLDWGRPAIETIRMAQSLGQIRPDLDAERLYLAILGMVHSQVQLWLRKGPSFNLVRSASLIGDILMNGIQVAEVRLPENIR